MRWMEPQGKSDKVKKKSERERARAKKKREQPSATNVLEGFCIGVTGALSQVNEKTSAACSCNQESAASTSTSINQIRHKLPLKHKAHTHKHPGTVEPHVQHNTYKHPQCRGRETQLVGYNTVAAIWDKRLQCDYKVFTSTMRDNQRLRHRCII